MPGSGQLDTRVTFQQRAPDDNGDPLGDWEDGFTRWAQVQYLRGGEGVIQGRLQGRDPAVITVRDEAATREITTAWRAVTQTGPQMTFNLRSWTPAKERGFIDILAEAGADE